MASKDLIFRFLGVDAGAGPEFERMGAYADSTAASFKRMALGGLTVAGVIGIASVKMAADFQTATERIHTQANVSNADVNKLRQGMLQMAGAVSTTPTVLADAAYHIASVGQHSMTTAQELRVLKIAAEGAKLGGADLTDVTNALDAALVAHLKGVHNYSQAMGILNAAVGAGDMTMQDMADAFGPLGATFKGFNVTIQQASAALATFGDNNIRGKLAGGQLRQVITSLADPLKFGVEQLQQWGIKSGNLSAQLQHGGLTEALDVLTKKFRDNGYAANEVGPLLAEMFGKRGPQQGLSILINELDRYHSKLQEVTQGGNNFASSWGSYTNTFGYALDKLRSSAESLLIQLGNKLLPAVTALVNWLSNTAVPVLSQFGHWIQQNATWIKPLAIAIAGIAAVMAGPVTATIAFTVALVELYKRSATAREVMQQIGQVLRQIGQWIVNNVVPAVQSFVRWFQQAPGPVKAVIAVLAAFGGIMAAPIAATVALGVGLVALWDKSQTFRSIVTTVLHDISVGFQDFLAGTRVVFAAVGQVWQAFVNGPVAWVKQQLQVFTQFWDSHSQQIETIAKAAWKIVETVIRVAVGVIKAEVMPMLAVLEGGFRDAFNAAKAVVSTALHVIADVIGTEIKVALDALGIIIDLLTGKWGKAWNEGKKLVSDVIHGIGKTIADFAKGAGTILLDAGKAVINGLWAGMKSAWHEVTGWIGSLAGHIKSLKGPLDYDRVMLNPEGQAIMLGLKDGMLASWNANVVPFLTSRAAAVQAALATAAEQVNAAVRKAIAPTSTSKIVLSSQYSGALSTAIPQQALSDQMAKQLATVTKEQDAEVASAQKHYNQTVAAYQKYENQLQAAHAKSRTKAQAEEVAALEAAKQAATKNLSDVKNAASGAISAAKNAATAAATAAKNATQAAATAASALVNQLQTQVTNMIQKIQAFQSTLSTGLTGDDSIATLWGNITTAQTNAAQAVADAQTQLASAQQNVTNSTAPTAADLQAVTDATTALTTAQQALTLANQAATPQGLQSSLGSTLTSAKQFAADLQALVKAGASQDLISQIAGMGPQTGDALAQQLLGAGQTAIKQMSATMATIAKYANSAAQSLSHDFYGQGANALAQFIAGLEKKYPALIKALDPIRKQLSSIFGQTAPSITAPKGATAKDAGPSKSDFQKQWTKETADRKDLRKLIDQGNKVSKEKLAAAEAKLINIEQALIKSAGTNHTDQDRVVRAITQIGPELAAAALISARKGAKN